MLRFSPWVGLLIVACGPGQPASSIEQGLPSTSVVISQLFGAGGATGTAAVPPFRTDFVELRNLSSQPVALANLSLQYASSMGSNWLVAGFDPSAVIAPGGFHLVAFTAGTGTRGAMLPTPDTSNPLIDLARSDLKLGLVDGVAPLSGTCPLRGADATRIIDFVGAGAANCFEGAQDAGAPAASVATGLVRRNDGCLDTDENALDFEAIVPTPRSSAAAPVFCQTDGGSTGVADAGVAEPVDAGLDAGLPTDAGAPRVDAGTSPPDAGRPDAGAPPADAGSSNDAGTRSDAGASPPDAGTSPSLNARSGCRCSSVDPTFFLLAALLARRRLTH